MTGPGVRCLPLLGLLALMTPPALAQLPAPASEQRLALVIGNSAYKEQPLRNPANDARAMTATLGKLGFTVIERIDAGRRVMEEAVLEFGEKLKAGGVGLFYYAGHGVQARGFNYLVPVDAAITSEASVRVQALDVGLVLDLMTDARNRANIVILDSCRNNPFLGASRGARGLAAIDAGRGTLIAYSTSPGAVAVDGEDANSPYTAALVKTLEEPGLKVEELFKRVRMRVVDSTQGTQTPWESSSLTGDLIINLSVTVKPPPPPQAAAPAAARDPADVPFWASIQASGNPRDFQEYLKQFPAGTFRGLAKRRLDEVSRKAARAPTRQALAATVDPGRKPASAAELLDRTYANAMSYILPRSKHSEGPNRGKPYLYREAARDKAMAICIDWQRHVAQTYGRAPPAEGAGILGWRAGVSRSGVASAREEALAICWSLHAAKGCSCEVFDENDQNALKIPDAVVAALVAPARAAAPVAPPAPAAAPSRPAPAAAPVATPPPVRPPQQAAAPATAGIPAAKRLASLRELTDRTYQELFDYVLPRTKIMEGPDKGKPYDYRGRRVHKAIAACVDWRAHERIYRENRAAESGSRGSVNNWYMAAGEISLDAARAKAMARCTESGKGKDCACSVMDENDNNVLEVALDYARRTLVDGDAQTASEAQRRKEAAADKQRLAALDAERERKAALEAERKRKVPETAKPQQQAAAPAPGAVPAVTAPVEVKCPKIVVTGLGIPSDKVKCSDRTGGSGVPGAERTVSSFSASWPGKLLSATLLRTLGRTYFADLGESELKKAIERDVSAAATATGWRYAATPLRHFRFNTKFANVDYACFRGYFSTESGPDGNRNLIWTYYCERRTGDLPEETVASVYRAIRIN